MTSAFRRWLLLLTTCIFAVVGCVYYVDRPVAEFFNIHLRQTPWWQQLNYVLAPFVLVVVAALFFLLGASCRLLSGNQLPPWTLKPLLCSLSVVWALAAETIFKGLFGRGWPDPTYIENHLYGFHWLHGSEHWSSFPSGAASIDFAILVVTWFVFPRLRLTGIVLTAALLSGVIITNGHWISDVVAGAFLGGSIGWMTVRLPYSQLAHALTPSNA